ncbi:hypothetical protein PT286_09105 [Neisseriaceae bacterium ESL0693]|nr:hypothetical protein [Neisseriaceae bacterium ESL0693]
MNMSLLKDLDDKCNALANEAERVTLNERQQRMKSVNLNAEMSSLMKNKDILDIFIRLRDK